MFKSNLGKVLQ